MKTNICVNKQRCALKDIVVLIAAERDENREAQNQRQWNHIVANAEMHGDSLGYDGAQPWG